MIDKSLRDLERLQDQDSIRLKLLQRRLGQGVYVQNYPRPIKVFNSTELLIDISEYGYRFELSREGYGSGYGYGYGLGDGSGSGYRSGYGFGYGDGAAGLGDEDGYIYGDGSGNGYGFGFGNGYGCRSGEFERLYDQKLRERI